MMRLSLDAIVYIANQLTTHEAADPWRIVYLCAHVLPTMDMDKAPYDGGTLDWDTYLDAFGIRPKEKRWVKAGFMVFEGRTLHFAYESEHIDDLMRSMKMIGRRLRFAEGLGSDGKPGN